MKKIIKIIGKNTLLISMVFLSNITTNAQTVTTGQYLNSIKKPIFRPGNTLIPLTASGYGDVAYDGIAPFRSFDTYFELATNWGYALQLDPQDLNPDTFGTHKSIIDDPNSKTGKMIELARTNPSKYKLSANIIKYINQGKVPFTTTECPDCFAKDAGGNFISEQDTNGNVVIDQGKTRPVINPFISDANLLRISKKLASTFEYIARKAPITIALDEGESGVFIPKTATYAWGKVPGNPNITVKPNVNGGWQWVSDKWNRAMKGFWQEIPKYLTNDGFVFTYINDSGSNTIGRFQNGFEYFGWQDYAFDYRITKDQTKYAMGQGYYGEGNLKWICDNQVKTDGFRDPLTQYLYVKVYDIAAGKPYNVQWMSSGWDDNISDDDRWTGYLKCIYTAGVIGGNVGFYGDYMKYKSTFDKTAPPFYVRQLASQSRVQAIFSWIEPFTMQSDLLEGQKLSEWGGRIENPSYEFFAYTPGTNIPASTSNKLNDYTSKKAVADCGARVVARKLKNNNKYILTAWAMTGEDREVEVELTGVGKIKVTARKAGSIYHIDNTNGTLTITLLDNDAMGVDTDEATMKTTFCYLYPGTSCNDIVANGSFENPSVSTYRYNTIIGGSWSFEGNSGVQHNGSIWSAANTTDGVQTAFLQGAISGSGKISQKVIFASGTYGILFKAARRNGQIQPIKITVDGIQVGGNITPAGNNFTDYLSQKFTVAPGPHTIAFETTDNSGDKTTFIDKVSLNLFSDAAKNGGFENPPVTTYQYNPTGSNWSFEGNSGVQHNGSIWSAANTTDGVQTAFLQSAPNVGSKISCTQLFASNISYTVYFYAARRSGQIQPIKVTIDGIQVGNYITPTDNNFSGHISQSFTVSTGFHTIALETTDNTGDKSVFIDRVVTLIKPSVSTAKEANQKTDAENNAFKLNSQALTIYPNPSNGNFNVLFDSLEKGDYKLEVLNVLGQVVYQETMTNFSGNLTKTIDISGKTKGIYLINLSYGDSKIVKKLILN